MAKDRIEIEILAKGVKEAQKDIEGLKKEIKKTEKDTKSSGESMLGTFGAIAAGAFAAFQTIKQGMNLSREFALFQQGVKAMESQFGVSANKIIKELDKVAKGTISNADLISGANRAMALNVTQDVGEMAELLEVARVRGQAMGIDTTQAFNDIVTGIGRGCLAGDTEIQTNHGIKKIKDIKEGDKVLSFNFNTNEMEFRKVNTKFAHGVEKTFKINYADNSEIIATAIHSFYIINNNDWRKTRDLKPGDQLFYDYNGVSYKWGQINYIKEYKDIEIYDLSVDENENYFANGVLCHNSPLILDNLGIITKGWAEEAKAAGKAMDAQFILNKVLADGREILKKTGDVALTDAEKFQKMEAQAKNLKLAIGQQLLPEVFKITDAFLDIGKGKGFEIIIRGVRTAIALVRFLALQFTTIGRIFVLLLTPWKNLATTIINGFNDIKKAFKAFIDPFRKFDGTIKGAKAAWQSFKDAGKLSFNTLKDLSSNFKKGFINDIETQIKSGKKEYKDLLDSVKNIFGDIDDLVKKSNQKRGKSGTGEIDKIKLDEKEKLSIRKQAFQASKQAANDFFGHLANLRQADLESTIRGLEEERQARLTAQGTAAAELAELDKADQDARLASLQDEKNQAMALGDAELAAEKQREIDRINLLDRQKKEEAAINEEFDEKIKTEKKKAAQADRKAKILAALANAALAITSTLAFTQGGPVIKGIAASIIAAAAAGQIAIIRNTPIPEYRQGTDFAPEGNALVGEEGPEIVNLPQGASVTPTSQITNESFDNRNITINVSSPNAIEFVNDLQQTYGINAFEGAV